MSKVRRIMGAVLAAGLAGLGAGVHAQGDLAGTWRGAVALPGTPLEVVVELREEAGGWRGTIDIPAQGAQGLTLSDIRVAGGSIRFAIEGVQGDPTFDGMRRGERIEGTFTQGGQEAPFTLTRGEGTPSAEGEDEDQAQPARPATPGPAAGERETVEDPTGRYALPVPRNWRAEASAEGIELAGPDGSVRVHTFAIEVQDVDGVEGAIDEAWSRVDPEFDREPWRRDEPPARGGFERFLQLTYSRPDDDVLAQAVARLHDGTVYVQLVEGEMVAAQRRSSQLNVIVTGLDVHAAQEEELSPDQARAFGEAFARELDTYLGDAVDRFDVPGATVAVVQDGRIVYTRGIGRSGPEGKEVTPSTRMMIGSTTKTLTTLLMARLVDRGELAWDTPVREVLPSFEVADPDVTERLTVQDLVCACTGVPRRDFELLFQRDVLGAEAVVESLADFEFFTEVGEAFQYSNQMVAAGGYAAAAAAGAPYGDLHDGYVRAMARHLLEPMGLASSTFSFEEVRDGRAYAQPHALRPSFTYRPIPLEQESFVTPVAPAGALWSTATDMGRYLITLLQDGVAPDGLRVVSEANLRHLWTPRISISADTSYGLGWMISDYHGLRVLHHGGNTLGFTSDLALIPGAGVGVSVLTNAANANAFTQAIRHRVFELVFDRDHSFDQEATFARDAQRRSLEDVFGDLQQAVSAETVASFTGRYTHPALGEVELRHGDGTLILDAGEFATDLWQDSDADALDFVATDTPVLGLSVRLRRDEAGAPTIELGQGVAEYVFAAAE